MSEIPPAVLLQSGKSECISFQNCKAKIKNKILCNFLRDIDIMRQIIANRTPIQVNADVSADHIRKVAIRAAVTLGALAFAVAGAAAACYFLLPGLPIPIVPIASKLVIALATMAFRCGQYAYQADNKDKVNSEKTLDHRESDTASKVDDTKTTEPEKTEDEKKPEPEHSIKDDTKSSPIKPPEEAEIPTDKDPVAAVSAESLGEEIATTDKDITDDKPIPALGPLASSMPTHAPALKTEKEESKPPTPVKKAEPTPKVEVKSPEITTKASAKPEKSKEDPVSKEGLDTAPDLKKEEAATDITPTSDHKATVADETKDKKSNGKTKAPSTEKSDKKPEKSSKISTSELLVAPKPGKPKDTALSPKPAKKREEVKVEKPITPTKAGEIKEDTKKQKKIPAKKPVDPLSRSTITKRALPPIIEPTPKSEEKSKPEDDLSAELSTAISAGKADTSTHETDSKIDLDQLKAQILQQNEAVQAVHDLTNKSKFSESEEPWLENLRNLLPQWEFLSNDELQEFSTGLLQAKFVQQRLLLQRMSGIVSLEIRKINKKIQDLHPIQNLHSMEYPTWSESRYDEAFAEMRRGHAQIQKIRSYRKDLQLLQPVQAKLQEQLSRLPPGGLVNEPIAWDLHASIERSIQALEAKKTGNMDESERGKLQKQIDALRDLGKQKPGKLLLPQAQRMQKNLQSGIKTALNSVNKEIEHLPEAGGFFGFFKKKDPRPDQLNDIKRHLEDYQQQLKNNDIQPQPQEQFERLLERGKQISISNAMLQQAQESGIQPEEIAKMQRDLDLMLVDHLQQLRMLGQEMGLSKDQLPPVYSIKNLKNLPAEKLVSLNLAQCIKSHIDQMHQREHILHGELSAQQQEEPIETIDRVQREMRIWLNSETPRYPEDNTEPGVLLRKLLNRVNGAKLEG